MKSELSTRLIVWVGVPAVLIFSSLVALSAWRSYEQVELNAGRTARAVARQHASMIESFLRSGERIAEMMAAEIATGKFETDDELRAYLRSVLQGNAGTVYGSCIAFKPHTFAPEVAGYAPYYYWANNELVFENLAKRDYNYLVWDWYRLPRDRHYPVWSEPYFDEGGGETLMTTYSVPFTRNGEFCGIVTIDITLSELLKAVQRIGEDEALTLGEGCYAFIIGSTGRFLVFPGRPASHVMERSLETTNPKLAAEMKAGGDGVIQVPDPRDGKKAWVAYAPILFERTEADGSSVAPEMSLGIVSVNEGAINPARQLLTTQIALGVMSLGLLFGAIILVARSVSRPIRELADATKRIAQGDLDVELSANALTITEVRDLTAAFKRMTRDLRLRMEELQKTTAVKEHLEGELSAARSIQMSLLPKDFPAFPNHPEIDVHAIVQPAREVGGDFYDFFQRGDGRLCFVIGDVSGKGVPAALFMAVSKALVKADALSTRGLNEIMTQVNAELCEDAEAGMFVTLVLALLDPATGNVEYCNAGHVAPLLVGTDGAVEELTGGQSPAMALAPGLKFTIGQTDIPPGAALFLFTDGVTEALDANRSFFGLERLHSSLRRAATEPADKVTEAVMQDVQNFCGERDQADDITVLCLRWLGVSFANSPDSPLRAPRKERFTSTSPLENGR